MPRKKGLSDKQEKFCHEYLIDLNATQAAIRAGYSKNYSKAQSYKLLVNVGIQKRLSELQQELIDKARELGTIATPEEVMEGFTNEQRYLVGSLVHEDGRAKLPHELDLITQNIVSGVDFDQEWKYDAEGNFIEIIRNKIKYKIPERFKNRDALAKHFGLYEKDNRQKGERQIVLSEEDKEIAKEFAKMYMDQEIKK